MAGAAGESPVRAIQRKAGFRMVEGFFPALPVNQIEIASVVFDVACFATVVRFPPVHSLSRAQLGTDEGVASKAFFLRYFFSRGMALRAVLQAFEPRMRFMERARGNLGHRRGTCRGKEKDEFRLH
jgi:hypothetical protein